MSADKLHIEYLSLSSLKPNAKNPRKHSKKQIAQIAKSIAQFGFIAPVLVDRENRVIAGHGRILAAQELGIAELPIIRLEHLSEAEAKAYMIADNKLTENAAWDEHLLAGLFAELESLEIDFSLDITGFDVPEIDRMLCFDPTVGDAPRDAIPDVLNYPVTTPGDLWLLNDHRIYCGNALNPTHMMALMDGDIARMVFTDPPYNVPIDGHVCGLGKHKHENFAMASGEMTPQEFEDFLSKSFDNMLCHSIDGSLHYICMDWRHMHELLCAGEVNYTEMKNLCIWVKDNGGMGSHYRSQHEMVFVYKHGKAPHINNVELGKHGRYRTNVWHYPGVNSFSRESAGDDNPLALHPTIKPVQMIADAIMDSSNRGDVILDAFLGSGSTLMAADKTKRRCFGMEIDPQYVDVAILRWQRSTSGTAYHALTGRTWYEIQQENRHAGQ